MGSGEKVVLRPEGPRVGVGFLGRGSQFPFHQLEGLGKRCQLTERGLGQSPSQN